MNSIDRYSQKNNNQICNLGENKDLSNEGFKEKDQPFIVVPPPK